MTGRPVSDHIIIPRDEYLALVRELKRGVEVCDEVSRLRVELIALERRLRELDQELTPVRPPSRTDIEAAFQASVEFARGAKKPSG